MSNLPGPVDVLVWVYVIVFLATAIITLGGILERPRQIQVKDGYLKALFSALVLEIVAGAIAVATGVLEHQASQDSNLGDHQTELHILKKDLTRFFKENVGVDRQTGLVESYQLSSSEKQPEPNALADVNVEIKPESDYYQIVAAAKNEYKLGKFYADDARKAGLIPVGEAELNLDPNKVYPIEELSWDETLSPDDGRYPFIFRTEFSKRALVVIDAKTNEVITTKSTDMATWSIIEHEGSRYMLVFGSVGADKGVVKFRLQTLLKPK